MRGLILDFDGVIADSMPHQERVWRQVSTKLIGRAEVTDGLVQNLYRGYAGSRMFEGIALSEDDKQCLRREKDDLWLKELDKVELAPGAAQILAALRRRVRIGVATAAAPAYVRLVLGRSGIETTFDAILTDSDVKHPKPHPEMLHVLMRLLGSSAEDALMVGDTITDYEMSIAAGVPFVRMRLGEQPDLEFEADVSVVCGWSELEDLLHTRLAAGAACGSH